MYPLMFHSYTFSVGYKLHSKGRWNYLKMVEVNCLAMIPCPPQGFFLLAFFFLLADKTSLGKLAPSITQPLDSYSVIRFFHTWSHVNRCLFPVKMKSCSSQKQKYVSFLWILILSLHLKQLQQYMFTIHKIVVSANPPLSWVNGTKAPHLRTNYTEQ